MPTNLDDLAGEFRDEIAATVESLMKMLPLSPAQLKAAFSQEEMKDLDEALLSIRAATDENERQAALANEAGIMLKLLSKLGVAVGA